MIFCCHRDSWLVIFFTTPDLPQPQIIYVGAWDAFCFFSLSTLSTLLPPVFFGGGIPDKPSPSPEVLFLTMIVVDRALYTWYRGDRRDEENTVATAASKTLAFASMKAPSGVGVVETTPGFCGWVWEGQWLFFCFFFKWRSNWREGTCAGVGSNSWLWFVFFLLAKRRRFLSYVHTWLDVHSLGHGTWSLNLRIVDNVESIEREGSSLVNCDATSYSFVTSEISWYPRSWEYMPIMIYVYIMYLQNVLYIKL